MVTTSYAGQGPGTNKGVQKFKNLIVLSVLAAFLVAGVVVAAVVNPHVLLGLGPALLAVAVIVRAVGGRSGGSARGQRTPVDPVALDGEQGQLGRAGDTGVRPQPARRRHRRGHGASHRP